MKKIFSLMALATLAIAPWNVNANHSWGGYHWARTSNPFTLQLGDNVSSTWDARLREASTDWSESSVLNTVVVTGNSNPKNCRPTAGRIEVCNSKYGNTGWLGIAQIWITGGEHITQATAKMNDTYFNRAPYNTYEWRQLVMCQEIAHGFGLDHQDENFNNANLGTCMDYTSNPSGPPSNLTPNQHDFDELASIYSHLDSFSTLASASQGGGGKGNGRGANGFTHANLDLDNASDWGKSIRTDSNGNPSLFVRDLGNNEMVVTHIFWANE